jgi:hypothetical protein
MKPSDIEVAIFAAEQSLATVREAKLTAQAAYDAQVIAELDALNKLSSARALVADEPEITPEHPAEEPPTPPPPARFNVATEPDAIAIFTRNGTAIERAADGTLEAGVYVVTLGREEVPGYQSATTEFTLAAHISLRLNGGQVQVIIEP